MTEFKKFGGAWVRFISVGVACTLGLAACESEVGQSTLLNPEGPPMIRQVFLSERVTLTTDNGDVVRVMPQLAFGAHPDFRNENEQVGVLNAVAHGNQRIRIVVDELLVGNYLEEIPCNDGTSWDTVPPGATPDDIEKCSPPDLSRCSGEFAVCNETVNGLVGILDADMDGAPDNFRMIDGAVTLTCDGQVMPLNRDQSFYQPSGNQLIPAGPLGINGLGPAIIIVPCTGDSSAPPGCSQDDDGIRTGSQCTISFSPTVVDKDGNRICAPPGGDITQACASDGDTSLVTFTVEKLALTGSDPARSCGNPPMVCDNVSLISGAGPHRTVLLQFNASIDATTLDAITATADGAPTTNFTLAVRDNDKTIVEMVFPTGLQPTTDYVVTIGTGLTDIWGGAVPAPIELAFRTRAATTQVDAAVPDAAPTTDAVPTDAGADAQP